MSGEMEKKLLGGRYRIDALIGRGGMSDVYRGMDVVLQRQVAIKILTDRSEDLRKRFLRGRALLSSFGVGLKGIDLGLQPLDVLFRLSQTRIGQVSLHLGMSSLRSSLRGSQIGRDIRKGNIDGTPKARKPWRSRSTDPVE